jgi:hypothetical protein
MSGRFDRDIAHSTRRPGSRESTSRRCPRHLSPWTCFLPMSSQVTFSFGFPHNFARPLDCAFLSPARCSPLDMLGEYNFTSSTSITRQSANVCKADQYVSSSPRSCVERKIGRFLTPRAPPASTSLALALGFGSSRRMRRMKSYMRTPDPNLGLLSPQLGGGVGDPDESVSTATSPLRVCPVRFESASSHLWGDRLRLRPSHLQGFVRADFDESTHFTPSTLALAMISIRFFDETPWATAAAYLLLCIRRRSSSETLWTRSSLWPEGSR